MPRTQLAPARAAQFAERAVYAVAFAVGTSTVAVRFSRADCAVRFAARYRDAASDRAPDLTMFAVEDGADAYFWAAASERVWRWSGGTLPPESIAFLADGAALYEFLCDSSLLGFHAAVLGGDSGVCALIGETTAGKTTTAVACVRRGLRLYSDERCILEDGLVTPFLRRMTLRAGGRAALLADPFEEPLDIDRRLRGWCDLDEVAIRPTTLLETLAGGPALPLAAVCVIDGRASAPELRPVPIAEIMPELLSSMASRESGLDRIARILHELRAARTFRLRLGPPDATARAILAEIGPGVAR